MYYKLFIVISVLTEIGKKYPLKYPALIFVNAALDKTKYYSDAIHIYLIKINI